MLFDLRRCEMQKIGYFHEFRVAVLLGRQTVILRRVLHVALTHSKRHRALLEHTRRWPHVIPVLVDWHLVVASHLVDLSSIKLDDFQLGYLMVTNKQKSRKISLTADLERPVNANPSFFLFIYGSNTLKPSMIA